MSKIVIFGNGAIAQLVYSELTYNTSHEVAGFTVDEEYIKEDKLYNLAVIPFQNVTSQLSPKDHMMFIAAGYVKVNKIREERYLQAKKMGYQFINIISRTATTYPDLVIGENCFISHNTIIYNDVKIGNNVFIGAACAIAHNVEIGDNCFLSDCVAVSGYVNIMNNCFLGTNSTIRNKVDIGMESVIGAGAIILENVEEKSVYLGEPSEKLSISSNQFYVP